MSTENVKYSMKNQMTPNQMTPIFPQQKQYFVIDWSNFVYRAFYSINPAKTLESLDNTENAQIDVKKLSKVLELLLYMLAKQFKQGPDRVIAATEGNGKNHRQKLFPAYKAQRSGTKGLPLILSVYQASVDLISATRCEVVWAPEGEADDAIAAIVKRCGKNVGIRIISEDRDLWQLIRGDRVVVHSQRRGLINEAACRHFMGVPPTHVACLKAFMGDTSDNVPRGVPRMKTDHIKQVAALDTRPGHAYRKAVEKELLSKKVLARVVKHKEQVNLNFEVVRLRHHLRLEQANVPRRPLATYVAEFGLDIDPETMQLLTGQNPT